MFFHLFKITGVEKIYKIGFPFSHNNFAFLKQKKIWFAPLKIKKLKYFDIFYNVPLKLFLS